MRAFSFFLPLLCCDAFKSGSTLASSALSTSVCELSAVVLLPLRRPWKKSSNFCQVWLLKVYANTVQQELQRALSILLRKEIEVVGAGRTDTGVHARKMAAHFDWELKDQAALSSDEEKDMSAKKELLPISCDQMVYRLN